MRKSLTTIAVLIFAASVGATESDHIERASSLVGSGRFSEAKSLLESEVAIEPRNAEGFFLLGQAQLGLRDPQSAMNSFERAIEILPEASTHHLWLARAAAAASVDAGLLSRGLLARTTRRELQNAIDLNPADVEARLDLIRFFSVAPAIVGGGRDRAYAEATRLNVISAGDARLGFGIIAWSEGNFDAAVEHFRSAVQSAKERKRAWLWLGYGMQRLHRWGEAFDAHESLGRVPNAGMHACFETGRTTVFSGVRLDEGRKCLERYTRHAPRLGEPSIAGAYLYLGRLERRAGNLAIARRHFLTAARLDPRSEEIQDEVEAMP